MTQEMADITFGDIAHDGLGAIGRLTPPDRMVVDALLDPWILLRPIHGADGQVVDFGYVDMNRRAAEFANGTRAQLIGSRLAERRPDLRSAGLVALLAEVVDTGNPLILDEHPCPSADAGPEGRFDLRASLVGTEVALTWRDATDRHEQHRRFELLVNNVADVVLLSRDGILEWVSPNVFALLGWTPEEAIGRLGDFLVHPGDRTQLHHARAQSRAGESMTLRLRFLRKDGGSVWCATQARSVPDPNSTGGVDVVVSLRDISKRVLVEQERDATEALYRLVAENVSDVVYTSDASGRFTWVSPSIESELGWSADELVGRDTADLLFELGHADMEAARSEIFDASRTVRFDRLRVRCRNGGHRWMTLTAHTSQGPDGVPVAVVSLHDVEKEMAERRASDTLSAANALVAGADDERTLLRDTCEMAVATGGYRFAWYGRSSPPSIDGDGRVIPVASSTEFAEYLDGLVVSTGGGPYGRCPTGVASRTGRTAVSSDLATDADWSPWSERDLAKGFRSSAGIPVVVDGELDGILVVLSGEPDAFDDHSVATLEEVAAALGNGMARLRDRKELRHAFVNSIDLVAAVVESRDPYTAGHQALVAELARAIGAEMQVDEHCLNGLSFAARIHDVGKIGVPIDILCRPGRLADEEMAVVRRHAIMGWEIAGHFDWPWPIAEVIHQHHEHFDGSGYPQGLAGSDILLESRIIAVADTYQAVASRRPYRAALGTERAREIVQSGSGTMYDPEVVLAFFRVLSAGFTFSPLADAY
jgi:PAS domain S-box-containing protein